MLCKSLAIRNAVWYHTIILQKGANIMENFPKYYTRLFNGVTDAIEALLIQRPEDALNILVEAQQDAEDMYMEDGDE